MILSQRDYTVIIAIMNRDKYLGTHTQIYIYI